MTIEIEAMAMRRIPMFAGVEMRRLKMLAASSQRLKFIAGQAMFHEGDEADAAYVVLEGRAAVIVAKNGHEQLIAEIGKYGLVGELGIVCDMPRTATVRAVTELETLRIAREQFLLMLREEPEVAAAVLRVIGERLAVRTVELTRLIGETAEDQRG